MNNISIILLMFLLSFDSFAQVNWFVQSSGTTANLHDVYFKNEKTGWAVGDSTVLMTTDGGLNWIQQIVASTYILYDVFFCDADVGWIVGENTDPNTWPGVLIITTNGGANWHIQLHPYMTFRKVHFFDRNNGFALRIWENKGIVSKTEDSGSSWSNIYINIFHVYKNMFFTNRDTGLVVGAHNDQIEHGSCAITTNGGDDWNTLLGWPGNKFNSVYFARDGRTGWVVGNHGIILKTSNSGVSWDRQLSLASDNLSDVYILSSEIGWIVGENGVILNTTNSGVGWWVNNVGVTRDLNSVFFVSSTDPSPGWIVGDNGLILSNTHGQVLDVEQTENVFVNEFSLSQNYPNPFNPTTTLSFVIGHRSFVILKVFDILGNEIATLINEELPAGEYEVEFDTSSGIRNLVSGVYFYQLIVGGPETSSGQAIIQTRKMVYLK